MTELSAAIAAALAADKTYQSAVETAGFKSRWGVDKDALRRKPWLHEAFLKKVAADRAMADAFDQSRRAETVTLDNGWGPFRRV